jgi:hypothetical protein
MDGHLHRFSTDFGQTLLWIVPNKGLSLSQALSLSLLGGHLTRRGVVVYDSKLLGPLSA